LSVESTSLITKMSTESHPSPTGSSSSQYGGGGNSAGANENFTQPSPAKPTWAQILNSTPNNSSTTTNNPQIATSSSSSQQSAGAAASKKTISPSTANIRPTNANPHDQQHSSASQINNWPLNFTQSSSAWMMDDENQQRNSNSSQQSIDNDQNANASNSAEAFDRLESSSPTEWKKPVLPNNSNANGWSNFGQQQQQHHHHHQKNPSRSNPTNNQWIDMNNFYGTTTSGGNFSSHGNDPSNTWQDPSTSSGDVLSSTSNNSVMNKHKTSSSTASSISGVFKSNLPLTTNAAVAAAGVAAAAVAGGGPSNIDNLPLATNESTINAALQPKLIEQLGWDEPDIQVTRRPNFDDGTSIWGDPIEMANIPVKKWTNGTKSTTGNVGNQVQQQGQSQSTPPPSTPTAPPNPGLISKQMSSVGNPASQMVMKDDNWPKQQSPTLGQPPSSSSATLPWDDSSVVSSLDPTHLSQAQNNRLGGGGSWNNHQQHQGNSNNDEWFREGVVDTSSWGLQGPAHKAPFDPYEGTIDTSGWGVHGPGGPGGNGGAVRMPGMTRPPFMDPYNSNEDPHHSRILPYDASSVTDPYRTNLEAKNPMMTPSNILPLSSNPHSFVPRPGPLYPPSSSDNALRPINPNGGIQTPPGAPMMAPGNVLSPKMPTSSPIPSSTNPSNVFPSSMPGHLSGNGNNPANGNNNGAVHAQIMQQFRLAVQAGLISQDLLNTKLPAYMLQLLQRLFEFQQKFQSYSYQLSDLNKQKSFFPPNVFQNEFDTLSKAIAQKKQEMLAVQKEIQDAHNKLKQQQQQQKSSGGSQSSNPSASQMMGNNPSVVSGPASSGQANPDQSRLHRWTKQPNTDSGMRGGVGGGMFPPPPGLTPKDWASDAHDSNENWEQNSANPFTTIDDIDGPPPFIPGQLWTWKPPLSNIEDDPHVTPSSYTMGPKGLPSPMGNLNVGGAESAFSNPHLMQGYPRHQQSNRSQWQQGPLHDQTGFAPPMNDWNKAQQQQQQQQQQQYRGGSKLPHPSFGGSYRPYP